MQTIHDLSNGWIAVWTKPEDKAPFLDTIEHLTLHHRETRTRIDLDEISVIRLRQMFAANQEGKSS